MIYETIFSKGGGEGFVSDSPIEINTLIDPIQSTLAGEVLEPECQTNLSGYLVRKVKYKGILHSDGGLVLFLGEAGGLFPLYYYIVVHKIDEHRIFQMFTTLSGRDFHFKNGKWV